MREHGRRNENCRRDHEGRRRRDSGEDSVQPRINNGRRQITRLMTERGWICPNTDGLIRSLTLVARCLCRRRRTVVVAAHRARQLAGGGDHRWSNQDQHERRSDQTREHRHHRSTMDLVRLKADTTLRHAAAAAH